MDKLYWATLVDLMRRGVAYTIAKDMADNELGLHEHFAAVARQRQNEAA